MKLEDKMAKYETVNSHNCGKCGNPWFFNMFDRLECTMCAYEKMLTEKFSVEPTVRNATTEEELANLQKRCIELQVKLNAAEKQSEVSCNTIVCLKNQRDLAVEGLRNVVNEGKVSLPCPDEKAGCAVYHYKYNHQAEVGRYYLQKVDELKESV